MANTKAGSSKTRAVLELVEAMQEAVKRGGDTVGIEDGVQTLANAILLASNLGPESTATFEATGPEYKKTRGDDFIGYIKIVYYRDALNSAMYPVRRAKTRTDVDVAALTELHKVVTKRQQDDARAIERLVQSLGWALNRLEYGPALAGDEHDTEQLKAARRVLNVAVELGQVPETTFAPQKEVR